MMQEVWFFIILLLLLLLLVFFFLVGWLVFMAASRARGIESVQQQKQSKSLILNPLCHRRTPTATFWLENWVNMESFTLT